MAISVAKGVQETDPKDSDSEIAEVLDPEDSETTLFQLGGDSGHSEEPPWKSVGKDDHPETRKGGEEVIQAARNLVYLEQLINGEEKSRRKNRGDYLESVIKEYRGKKGGSLETVGQGIFLKQWSRRIWKQSVRSIPPHQPHPPHPPHPEEVNKQLSRRIWKQLIRSIPPHPTKPTYPEEINEQLRRRIRKQLGNRIPSHPPQMPHLPHPEEVNKNTVLF